MGKGRGGEEEKRRKGEGRKINKTNNETVTAEECDRNRTVLWLIAL